MAVSTQPHREPFRLGMLLYDRRYRSTTIQVVALVLLLLTLSWLVNNAVENLARLGKEFNFGFLWTTANYAIDPHLVPYESTDTHFRAAIVGLLNTLAVAIPGCFLATLIGVIIGVLRLSKSWITARLMAVYIEVLRNVPVVIWLVVLYGILTLITPQPAAYRGEDPQASMIFGSIAITNRGTYFPALIFENSIGDFFSPEAAASGNWFSSAIANMAIYGVFDWLLVIAAIVGGVMAARRVVAWASRKQEATGLRPSTWYYQIALIVVPLAIVLTVLGGHLEFPALTGFNFQGGMQLPNSYLALLLGLAIYTSSYIAENVRAGIQAISHGQTEASYALGLRPGRTMSLIILPQALRIIIPPIISQWLNLTKNTSLGIFVTYTELKATLGGITMNQTGRELECNFLMMGIYLTISLLISAILNAYNKSVRLKER